MALPDGSNTLDGVALPVGGRWLDEHQWQSVGQTALRSLSGGYHVYSVGLSAGRPITLEFTLPYSWIYAAKLATIKAQAATAGNQIQLVWGGTTYDVMYRHDDAPAVDFLHVDAPGVPIDKGVYVGQIKLIEVA